MEKEVEKWQDKVKKSNVLIRSQIQVRGVWELRLFNAILARIDTRDEDFKLYTMSAFELFGDYRDFSDSKGGDFYNSIRQALSNVAKEIVELPFGKKGFMFHAMFISAGYDEGIISVKIHPDLKEHLLELKEKFTIISLEKFLKLQTVMGQRLFEILSSWKNQEEGYIDIPVSGLYYQLDIKESYQKNFCDFSRLLLRAKKDIEDNAKFKFEFSPLKKQGSKKVVSVRFVLDAEKFELYKKSLTSKVEVSVAPKNQSNKPSTKLVANSRIGIVESPQRGYPTDPQRGLAESPRSGFEAGSFDDMTEFEVAV